MRIVRVFPRKTAYTPSDGLAFVGDPPLFRPDADEVHVSCVFTWDKPEAERLYNAWAQYYPVVRIGGPAYGDRGDTFTAGQYVRPGVTFASRGCPNNCWFCFVPQREGKLRELPIVPGRIVQDNNLTACSWPHIERVFAMLRTQRAVEFAGGLEAARIDSRWCELLRSISLRQLFLAYDDPARDNTVRRAFERLLAAGFKRDKLRCFVLMGYPGDTQEAARTRCEDVWGWGGLPFAMLYRDETGTRLDNGWRQLQRTFSRPAATKAYFV